MSSRTVSGIVITFLLLLSFSSLFAASVKGQGPFVGSKKSDVYHYSWCSYVDNIKSENKVWFVDAQDAVDHGYRPCLVCKPPLPDSNPSSPTPEPTSTPKPTPTPAHFQEPIEFVLEVDKVAVVTSVTDGDTFNTAEDTIRLADVDAPELGENGYSPARNYLISLIDGKTVYLDIDDINRDDSFGRLICVVCVAHNSTHRMNVNQALLNGGYAVLDDYSNNEFSPDSWSLYVSVSSSSPSPTSTPEPTSTPTPTSTPASATTPTPRPTFFTPTPTPTAIAAPVVTTEVAIVLTAVTATAITSLVVFYITRRK